MRNTEKTIALAVFIFSFFPSCVPYLKYTPDPKKDVGMWVKNFDRQRSFVYEYRMRTQSTEVNGRGACVIGRGEHIKGRWQSASGSFDFEYYGIDDIEYSRKDGSWVESARGEESNIFVQIQRMLNFDKFELMEKEPDYHYRFKANVPFLAPGKWKEMVGMMRVSPKNFMPDFIWAGLPDSSVFWEARLKDYNRTEAIEAPAAKWNDFRITADSSADFGKLLPAVERRLRLIGVPFRLKTADRALLLSIPSGYQASNIEDLCAPGQAAINWLTSDKNQAVKIGYLMDDLKQPLLLTGEALDPQAIKDCRLLIDRVSRPYLQLILRKKLGRPGSLCLEVDSMIVSQMTIDKGQNLSIIRADINMGYYQMNIIRAAIIQPLPRLFVTPAPGE
jgi:hypothetical protein